MELYNAFIAKSRYARFREDLGRRENWDETVNRYVGWMDKQAGRNGYQMPKEELDEAVSYTHLTLPTKRIV